MITTAVIHVLWAIASPVLALIPDTAINYDGIANRTVYHLIRAGLYLLPIETVIKILTLIVALWVLRIVIAFLYSLWAALPIV